VAEQFPGNLRHVSVGAPGYQHVWGVNAQGQLWFHRSAEQETVLINNKTNQQLNQSVALQQTAVVDVSRQPATFDVNVDQWNNPGHNHVNGGQVTYNVQI